MAKTLDDITVVTTSSIVGEIIEETYGYVSAFYCRAYVFRKEHNVEKALDVAIRRLQFQAFTDKADAVIDVKTSLSFSSQGAIFTQVNVLVEGTLVTLEKS